MIALTHFSTGKRIALNIDLIEKVEETPDTVITLTNGSRYLVAETLDQIVAKSVEMRAQVMYMAHHLGTPPDGQRLRLVHSVSDPAPAPADDGSGNLTPDGTP